MYNLSAISYGTPFTSRALSDILRTSACRNSYKKARKICYRLYTESPREMSLTLMVETTERIFPNIFYEGPTLLISSMVQSCSWNAATPSVGQKISAF